MNAVIRKLIRQYQGLAISVGIVAVCAVAALYGLVPGGKRVLTLFEARQTLLHEVSELQKKMSLLGSLEESTLRTQLLTLTTAVPVDKSIPSAITTVDAVAAEAGVTLEGLTISNPGSLATESAARQTTEEKKLGSNILSFTFLANGTPQAVYTLLGRLVGVRRSLRVRFLDITFLTPTETNVRAAMDAFYAPLPTTLGDILTPVNSLTVQEEAILERLSSYPSYGAESRVDGVPPPTLPSLSRDPFAH